MPEQWNRNGYNTVIRLGQTAVRAQGLVLAQRLRSMQRLTRAHTRELLKHPEGQKKLAEVQEQIDKLQQTIKDGVDHGG
jgi:hypothetical protein